MKRWIIAIAVVVLLGTLGIVIAKVKSGGSHSETPSVPMQKLLNEASQYETQGDKVKLKETYLQILNDHADYDKVEDIQKKLGDLNIDIVFSKLVTPESEMYIVQPGDSLGKLSKQFNTTKELIKRSNNLKSDVIRVGAKLRIWKGTFTVHVNKSQNIMTLKSNGEIFKIYHVATGRDTKDNATPTGTFKIATRIPNPVWFKPGGKPVPPESPENELGSRWMGFDTDPHYGIHGTIHPEAVGQYATAGCVRLINSDVEELFDLLPVGTSVTIEN